MDWHVVNKIEKRRNVNTMNLPQDPMMLLSVVNMNLRDRYASLEEFCQTEDVDPAYLQKVLSPWEYEYDPATNQFR